MSACYRFVIYGKVQGVYFRAYTRRQAERLGLSGWVRNTPEGQVEVLACGPDEVLSELKAWLWHGPELARVTKVHCEAVACRNFEGFEIR